MVHDSNSRVCDAFRLSPVIPPRPGPQIGRGSYDPMFDPSQRTGSQFGPLPPPANQPAIAGPEHGRPAIANQPYGSVQGPPQKMHPQTGQPMLGPGPGPGMGQLPAPGMGQLPAPGIMMGQPPGTGPGRPPPQGPPGGDWDPVHKGKAPPAISGYEPGFGDPLKKGGGAGLPSERGGGGAPPGREAGQGRILDGGGRGRDGERDSREVGRGRPSGGDRDGGPLKQQPLLIEEGLFAEVTKPPLDGQGSGNTGSKAPGPSQRQRAITGGHEARDSMDDKEQQAVSRRARKPDGTADRHLGMTFQELREIFDMLDVNRDGSITYKEFLRGLKRNKRIAAKLGKPPAINAQLNVVRECRAARASETDWLPGFA